MKAMILAAGRGERMRPLTDTCPKPLLQAGGRPLIVWHIEALVRAGFTDIVINHAHLGHMIEATLGDGKQWGAHISYSTETEALETAGGIANALQLLTSPSNHSNTSITSDTFLVVNGDIACDVDFAPLRITAKEMAVKNRLAHLLMVPNPVHNPKGDFVLRDNTISEEETGQLPRLTFTGIGLYRTELFAHIPRGEKAKLAPLLRAAMQTKQVGGELFAGRWMDIGTPERLTELDRMLRFDV